MFNNSQRMFFGVGDSREQGYDPKLQQSYYSVDDLGVAPENVEHRVVAPEAFVCCKNVYEALWYLPSLIISRMPYLEENRKLYALKNKDLEDWPEATKCQSDRGRLLVLFREIPLRVMSAMKVRSLAGLTTQVAQVDKNAEFMTREV